MTTAAASPLLQDALPASNGGAQPPPAAPPKKRRRRTTAGGAGDDCFTCRNRGAQCDRKRPYCTQCMEIGNSCSGYKTQLTWGVGVASRGKLRGLTCPVANKKIDGTDADASEGPAKKRRKSSVVTVKSENSTEERPAETLSNGAAKPNAASNAARNRGGSNASATQPTAMAQQQGQWQAHGFLGHRQSSGDRRHTVVGHSGLQPLQTSLGPSYDGFSMPQSARSMTSYAETEFYSPMEFSPPGSAFPPFGEQLSPIISQQFSEPTTRGPIETYAPPPADMGGYNGSPSNSVSIASLCNFQDSNVDGNKAPDGSMKFDEEILRPAADNMDVLSRFEFMPDAQLALTAFENSAFSKLQGDEEEEVDDGNKSMMLADTRFYSPFYELTPRLQTLMSYYDINICPYLVTFDGPENPYRRHILQLATQNTGLQHALGALSLNNHRMRRAASQRQQQIGYIDTVPSSEPTLEESKYKQLSIDQLNMQLTDPRAAQDDGVLATLLILCLFHVCDSGFSKFRTQLAGVQKLLSMRRPNVQASDFTAWVEMFFTWFDGLTSTVNDREMQVNGDLVSMLDYSTNLGALEQFSGCDGRLFKLIARLGRLNLLAQGRPVKAQIGTETPIPQTPALHPTRKRFPKPGPKSLSPLDYANLDGNGWGSPIVASSDDDDAPGDPDSRATTPLPPTTATSDPDSRHAFWSEWHALRARLSAWQMDSPAPHTPQTAELDASHRDLLHINESFRYSALLYTSRLGSPLLPSSAPDFQTLVSQALYHITALPTTSCVNKFLLWPLFITGTECIDPGHREIIRTRCKDLTDESGFFNNLSSLEVLERVWAEGNGVGGEAEEVRARRRDSTCVGLAGGVGQAFRWRRAMDRVDGEYIVI